MPPASIAALTSVPWRPQHGIIAWPGPEDAAYDASDGFPLGVSVSAAAASASIGMRGWARDRGSDESDFGDSVMGLVHQAR